MKKPALLSLIRIPPLCAIQRCTSAGPFLFIGGVQWAEPKQSGSEKRRTS